MSATSEGELFGEVLPFALEAAEVGIWSWDPAAGIVVCSTTCKSLLGIPAGATPSQAEFLAALHPGDRGRTDAAMRQSLAEHRDFDIDCRASGPSGEPRWLRAKGRGAWDTEGRPLRLEGILLDVTERKTADEAQCERQAWLRLVLETAPDAVMIIDERGLIESFSPAAERLFGFTAAEVVGRNVSMLMPSPYRERHDSYLARYLATGERRIIGVGRVVTGQRKDGSTFPMELTVGEVVLVDRRLFTGFARDITERQTTRRRLQELQAELVRVTRANEIGQMGAALAHELNQPLTAVANYLQACRRFLETSGACVPKRVHETLEKAAAQAGRAGQVIRRLRQFMEKGETEQRSEDVNKIVEEASALALVGAKEAGIRVRLELGPEIAPVLVDKIQIQQVVLNLVRNAMEAMAEAPERVLSVRTAPAGAGFVEVTVSDTGPGLAPAVAEQLFQPFVTTKERGMGIGLSVCRSIIDAHGGRIWTTPNSGGGTIFAFTLPIAVDREQTLQ